MPLVSLHDFFAITAFELIFMPKKYTHCTSLHYWFFNTSNQGVEGQTLSLPNLEWISQLYIGIAKCSSSLGNEVKVLFAYRDAYTVSRNVSQWSSLILYQNEANY